MIQNWKLEEKILEIKLKHTTILQTRQQQKEKNNYDKNNLNITTTEHRIKAAMAAHSTGLQNTVENNEGQNF